MCSWTPATRRSAGTTGIQPHPQKHFKLSTDPFFAEKALDIVGLYLDPPNQAMGLCVDNTRQMQALEHPGSADLARHRRRRDAPRVPSRGP